MGQSVQIMVHLLFRAYGTDPVGGGFHPILGDPVAPSADSFVRLSPFPLAFTINQSDHMKHLFLLISRKILMNRMPEPGRFLGLQVFETPEDLGLGFLLIILLNYF